MSNDSPAEAQLWDDSDLDFYVYEVKDGFRFHNGEIPKEVVNSLFKRVRERIRIDRELLQYFCSLDGFTLLDLTEATVSEFELQSLHTENITGIRCHPEKEPRGSYGHMNPRKLLDLVFPSPHPNLPVCYKRLTQLDLSYSGRPGDSFDVGEEVRCCPNLEVLTLDGAHLPSNVFDCSFHKELKALNLSNTTCSSIINMPMLTKLEDLKLANVMIDKASTRDLRLLSTLKSIVIHLGPDGTNYVSDFVSEIHDIEQAMHANEIEWPWSHLHSIIFSGGSLKANNDGHVLTHKAIDFLVETCPHLETIGFAHFRIKASTRHLCFCQRTTLLEFNLLHGEEYLSTIMAYSLVGVNGGMDVLSDLERQRATLIQDPRTFMANHDERMRRIATTTILYLNHPVLFGAGRLALDCLKIMLKNGVWYPDISQINDITLIGDFCVKGLKDIDWTESLADRGSANFKLVRALFVPLWRIEGSLEKGRIRLRVGELVIECLGSNIDNEFKKKICVMFQNTVKSAWFKEFMTMALDNLTYHDNCPDPRIYINHQ